ncbi:FAD-dependent 2-octaprenylphenol hydroxylase [Mergibacter septicus]|uniref:FAD-dependent 2-octaprenylphenol hydroxylase n=1 Tax=Mergibacter septicus TaxID=221402 RepID=A0A8D4IZI6_9PAST|nr:FAD-dependent monooxygenase [Mergibacter septicus]AWX14942.1 FAD-dependent 2-octaprenylphenol hydroxylase [Mergibacter septicus]QDJ14194.1 FAD-dependent 2-octaprenylphenol hydroxylase [Mergibacter septicus]UTU48359.1 FAD-dependent monooxygenase [Mergibacter septicus]WMR96014.1 FAD-dependent monooxygenase [Mergibacter septicus]
MKSFDLVIIGGGMVGLALAQALAQANCRIAIVEAYPPEQQLEQIGNRVSALNLASQAFLEQLGVWQQLQQWRATSYAAMQVWEKDSFAKITLDTKGLGVEHLGHIVENHLIRQALWQKVSQNPNVEIILGQPHQLGVNDSNAILSLTHGEMLVAKLVVGADGANSWLRQQADIPLNFRDYQHTALVCNVETTEPHQQICRQIFSHNSILAFLPLHQPNLSSIVWSLDPLQARELVACDEKDFNQALTVAFDNRLGLTQVQSPRNIYPLTARFARDFAQARIALIGDAAHTIHPLAGLGVNLGFMDALALAEQITTNLNAGYDIGDYRRLRYFERWRKTEATKMLTAMQAFKTLFEGSTPIKKLIRGAGLTFVDNFSLIKEQFILHATGLSGDLPESVKYCLDFV